MTCYLAFHVKKFSSGQSQLELWNGRFRRNSCMSIQLCSYHLYSLSLFHILLWETTQNIFYQEIRGLPLQPSIVSFTICMILRKLLRSFRFLFLYFEQFIIICYILKVRGLYPMTLQWYFPVLQLRRNPRELYFVLVL